MLFLLAAISRLIPHPANFTPVGAIGIYAAKKYGYKKAILITMCAMIAGDIFIGFGQYTTFVYLGILSYIFFQKIFEKMKLSPLLAALSGSIFFFLISNFGTWIGPWYEHSFDGLQKCFIMAIPFYKNTLFGDLIFTGILFGLDYAINKSKGRLPWQASLRPMNLRQKS